MISVEQAKELVNTSVTSLELEEIDVENALNYVLAEEVFAPISVPSFDQSAMDGYAFSYENMKMALPIIEEVAAGDIRKIEVEKTEAVRIFTGAKVPQGCDTVVMQELTKVVQGKLIVEDEGLKLGGNIRTKASQIETGSKALDKGTKISAGTVGFLSALGITKIKVYKTPKVTIIATGDELVKPGNNLEEGQIFESNTFMLKSALNDLNIEPHIVVVEDRKEATEKAVSEALANSDLLLLSGGISVGDYDFVKEALESNRVEEVFYKVKQKPGKPLFFGKTNDCYVFALPGNPAAALTCFYQYVTIGINKMKGLYNAELSKLFLPIDIPLKKKEGRAIFYKGYTDYKTVTITEGQGSDVLKSFSLSNCFVYLKADTVSVEQGEMVEVNLF